jgi:hypothetical protein
VKNSWGIVNVTRNFVRAAARRSVVVMIRLVLLRVRVIGCFDFRRASSVRRRVDT